MDWTDHRLGKAEVVSSILTGSTIFARSQSGGLASTKIRRMA